ncbi:MAG: hypothetical protein HY537_05945 [Deltaproteobacteria bacterium]|nr:hypothetical protein [Deltaproteobacteria bacterium]
MNVELQTLRHVSQKLTDSGIAYMITGSIALNYYSVPRMTRDIDLVAELELGDVSRLVSLFNEDFYIEPNMVREAIQRQSMFNIIHLVGAVKVDFIVRKDSDYRKTEFSRRRQISITDFTTWITTPEDLILSKLDWAKDSLSEMQLQDIRNLLRLEQLDWKYLNHWIGRLNLASVYERVKA